MNYLGDFAEDATVYIPLNTFSSDDPSASVTITNLADADVMVHKDGSTTQIVTDGATVAIDFDSITGNHLITIDTSVHADYSTGSDYLVRIEGTTVDGATINAWVGHFSIQNRYMRGTDNAATAAELAKVPKSDGTATWNATALASINAEADTALSDYDPPTKAELDSGLAALNDPTAAAIADAVLDEALSGHTTAGTLGKVVADIETDAAAILVDTAEIGAAGAGLTEAGGTGDQLTAVPWNAAWDAEVQSEVTDALNAYDPPTNAEMEARTLVAANYATATNLATVDTVVDNLNLGIIYGAAATGTLSTTQATTDLTGYADDQFIGRVIIWTSGSAEGEATDITDYANTGGLLTFTALTTAPANGDTFKIV